MKIGERLKAIGGLLVGYDKSAIQAINKSMSHFTNEFPVALVPQYSLTPLDVNSVDYRGRLDSVINGYHAASNLIELFHCLPEVFAPIDAVASRIANADYQLRKVRNDQVVYDNETWNRLFATPNPLQNFRELIYEAVVYEIITGNELMYVNTPSTLARNYQNVSAIWNLPADQIEILPKKPLKLYTATSLEDIVDRYKLDDNNYFKPEDVLHIRGVNMQWKDGKVRGKSKLQSAEKAIANLIAVYEARNVIYTKRGAMGFIVSRKSDGSGLVPMTSKERGRVQEDFQGTYGLTGGRGLLGITDVPVDYIKVGLSISELEPFKETQADAAAIYATLGVPEDMMPGSDRRTYENQIQSERRLITGTCMPIANRYVQSITNKLGLNEAKLYLHASFENFEALQENKKEKADVDSKNTQTWLQQFMNGVIRLNDVVVLAGYEKVSNPLYDKLIFDMTPEERATVKEVLNMKGIVKENNNENNNNQPAGPEGNTGNQ